MRVESAGEGLGCEIAGIFLLEDFCVALPGVSGIPCKA